MRQKNSSHQFRVLSLSLLLLFSFLLPLSAAFSVSVTAETAEPPKSVSFASPAIPATAGETVDLFQYSVAFTQTETVDARSISWTSTEISVDGGKVSPTKKGVYRLTASANQKSKTVYLVVKNPGDPDYVLYEEDFDAVTSVGDLDYTLVEQTNRDCTVSLKDGKLVLSAQSGADQYIRLLLPAYLGDFGDYKIEANAAMTAYQTTNRWMSFMFRVQNSNYPYYQMAIRANATASNGTELAERTASNRWNVMYTSPFTKAMTDGAYHLFTVEALGGKVRTAIDDYTEVTTETANGYLTGRVGLQVRACEMSLDKIRVILQVDPPDIPSSYMANVRDPASNIILPPAIVSEIDTSEELRDILNSSPATAIFRIDASLRVLDREGNPISTISEAVKSLNQTVIPAFRVSNAETVTALNDWLNRKQIADLFVVSDDPALVRAARDGYTLSRGILDWSGKTDLGEDRLSEIRTETNACGARICLLPDSFATKDHVEFLQRLFMTVWTVSSDDSLTGLLRQVTAGVNGIVTKERARLEASYTSCFQKNTVIRPTGIIGHRGVPSLAQENTLAGAIAAYEAGATAIENDIYLTRDGVLVVMHDATVDRTTNGTGNVSSFTLEELKKLSVDANSAVPSEPVPTLEEYFQYFKGKDVQIIIELKSSDLAICPALVELIKKYDILDQVNAISFHTNELTYLKKLLPGISVGYLTSALNDNESDPVPSVLSILNYVQTYDSTYNPSYNKGALGPNLLRAASYRGITVWPWTINAKEDITRYMLYGTYGITTNYSQYTSSSVKRVSANTDSLTAVSPGEIEGLSILQTTYKRVTTDRTANAKLVFLEGDDILTFENGVLTATGSGKATVLFSLSCRTPSGTLYQMYTSPVTVEVLGDSSSTTTDETSESETVTGEPGSETVASSETDDTSTPGGCNSALAGMSGLSLVLSLFSAGILLKKRKSFVGTSSKKLPPPKNF